MRVVLAEDHALLRAGLTGILTDAGHDVHGVADADGLSVALAAPDVEVAVVDIRLPPTHTDEGLRLAVAARQARPGLPVLVLSQYVERLYARELLASGEGSVGYLLKDRVADVAQFLDAVGRVAGGATILDPEVVASMLTHSRSPVDRLSPREREVLALMAEGRSNCAIAARLVVTERAVLKHVSAIFTKLDLPMDGDDHRRVRAVLAYLEG